jgi:hypothetical protein
MGKVARNDERGQVLPLLAVLMVVIGVAAMGVGKVGAAAASRAQAQTAADAAALAGAAGGKSSADALARQNGGRLERYSEKGRTVAVTVQVGAARATAKAERFGDEGGVQGSSTGLAPAMRAAIARAEELLGQRIPVASGFRSRAQQAALYERRDSNPYPVAPPGSSMHERGLAIDVPRSFVARLLTVAARAGLCRPYPVADPVHFEVCRR